MWFFPIYSIRIKEGENEYEDYMAGTFVFSGGKGWLFGNI
jgi:hypothetical protein